MKKHLVVSVALSTTLGLATLTEPLMEPTKVYAESAFTKEQQEGLDYLNSIRKAVGLKSVKLNSYLNKAAQSHADYLYNNVTANPHSEEQGKKGFTGTNSSERVLATGLPLEEFYGVGEVFSPRQESIIHAIDSFMSTAYHREALISTGMKEIGIGINIDGSVVIDYVSGEDEKISTAYPYDGQKDVGIGFYGMENPNPLEKFRIDKSGYIISYTPGPDFFVETLNFKLKDSKGNDVPVHLDENWMGTSFFFPKSELKYNETYTASVSYVDTYTGKTGGKTWSFTTREFKGRNPVRPTVPTTPVIFIKKPDNVTWSGRVLIKTGDMILYKPNGEEHRKLRKGEMVKVYGTKEDQYQVGGGYFVKKTKHTLFYQGLIHSIGKDMSMHHPDGRLYMKIKPKTNVRVFSFEGDKYDVGGGFYIKADDHIKIEW